MAPVTGFSLYAPDVRFSNWMSPPTDTVALAPRRRNADAARLWLVVVSGSCPIVAVFDPWPVMGSFSTTASAMPNTSLPEGSFATGLRTVGAKRPTRVPR